MAASDRPFGAYDTTLFECITIKKNTHHLVDFSRGWRPLRGVGTTTSTTKRIVTESHLYGYTMLDMVEVKGEVIS